MLDLIVEFYFNFVVISFFTLLFGAALACLILGFQVIYLWFLRNANANAKELS